MTRGRMGVQDRVAAQPRWAEACRQKQEPHNRWGVGFLVRQGYAGVTAEIGLGGVEDQVAAQRHGGVAADEDALQLLSSDGPDPDELHLEIGGLGGEYPPQAGKVNIKRNPESVKHHPSVYNEVGGFFDEFPAAIH